PLIFLATMLFRKKVRESYRRIRTAIARINSYLQEHVSGIVVLQLFNREKRSFKEFEKVNAQHMEAYKDAIMAHAVYYPVVEILSPSVPKRTEGPGRIELDHVWFAYREMPKLDGNEVISGNGAGQLAPGVDGEGKEWDWILRDVSFVIEPGETVAIVGHTGAGKTTIISLLMRFYDVQKGAIKIDGVDIKEMDLAELRRRFGVVLQDPFLFTGTIAGNIRLGTAWIEDSGVSQAAEDVNLADFVRSLPGGFEEEVRERGSTLSTGQKQLISFARALAHDP